MMASSKYKGISVITYLVIAFLLYTLTSQVEPKLFSRQVNCPDGEYEHDGIKCCFCPAGYKVSKHCTGPDQNPKCEDCPTKQFQSHPNQEMKCEQCTRCEDNPNANLVDDKPCTPYTDSTCKCKPNHYCPGRAPCPICEPCEECGPEGEKVACSATNNTVCNDKPQGSSPVGAILGVIIPVLVLVAALVFYCCYWRKRKESKNPQPGDVANAEVMPLAEPELPNRLTPYIPDIAEAIGWTTMRNLAMKSNIPKGTIESCEARHPNNNVENTIALLMTWEEKEGKDAAYKLINYLKEANQKTTADDVLKILRASSSIDRLEDF